MKLPTFCWVFLLSIVIASQVNAQGNPVCPPCNGPFCAQPSWANLQWDQENFCKDDTVMLWVEYPPNIVPEYFIWTLVDSAGNDPMWIGPTNNDTVFVLGLGLYCVQIVDTSGCFTSCMGMWPGDLPLVTQVAVEIDSSYCNEATGAIELTILDTNIPTDIEYIEWYNGSTQTTITDLEPGDYTVTITRHNIQGFACPVEYTFTVPSLNTLTVTGQVTDDFSCIEGNGNIDLHVYPPGVPYEYEWSNGMVTEDVLNLDPGTYTVTITGPQPCEGTGFFTVSEASEPILNATAAVLPAFCDLPTGASTVTIIGGAPPFSFEWSNGETENPASTLVPGEHSVTITGWGDCTFELTIDVPNDDAQVNTQFFVYGNTFCDEPDGSIDLTVTPDGGFYTFEWSNGSPLEDLYDVPGGIYTVTITAGSCTLPDTAIVPDNTLQQTLTHTVMSSICGDTSGAINLTVIGGDSPFTYLWSNGGATQDLTGLTGNWYIVTVTGLNGCVVNDSILVPNDNSVFTITDAITPNTSCTDSTGTIDLAIAPSGSYIFQWSNGASTEDLTNLASGSYDVTVTHSSGCNTIQQFIVADSLPLPDTTSLQVTTCVEPDTGLVTLVLIGDNGCDSILQLNYSFVPLDTFYQLASSCDPGNVGVVFTSTVNVDGCDSITQITTYYATADTTYQNAVSCDPSATGIDIDHFLNNEGCDSMVITTTTLLNSDSILIFSTTCDSAAAGTFTSNLVNQFGCDSIITTTVSALPSYHATINSTTCMSSQAGVFSDTLSNVYGCDSVVMNIIALLPGDSTLLNVFTCFADEVGSTHTILSNQFGCDSVIIESVSLYPLPLVELELISDFNGYPISCYGAMDGAVLANGSGVEPIDYIWSTGDMAAEVTGLSAGLYAVTLFDGNGCVAVQSISLTAPAPLSIALIISHPGCFISNAGSITINSQGGVAPIVYSIDGINFQSTPNFEALTGGIFYLVAMDANDCMVNEIVVINAPQQISIDAGHDQTIMAGDSAAINVITNVPYDMLASVEWTNLMVPACPGCLNQVVTPVITTTYSISLTSLDGCVASDSMTVFVNDDEGIYFPNVFTPNGDQINDRFLISAISGSSEIASLVIYDRWGNEVFENRTFQANDFQKSWDGTFKGHPVNPGVFAYHAVVIVRGQQMSRVGNVTLLR